MDGREELATHIRAMLSLLGYPLEDEHFRRTPERVATMLAEFTANGNPDEAARLLEVKFDAKLSVNSLVMVGPVRFISFCAHHMSQITGKAWVGYIPDQHICGLSKLARLVRFYSRQYTVQEVATEQIITTLEDELRPKGCMIVVKAIHSCMSIRGVEEPESITTTSAVRGLFKDSGAARHEFLTLMEGR